MEGNVLTGITKEDHFSLVEFKADLTLKMKFEMEFGRFSIFIWIKRSSEMENGSFEVVSNICLGKLFSRNKAFAKWKEMC